MPPVVSIVGKAGSGKTTFLQKLIAELKNRGYRVATIKHTPGSMSIGEPDKDSWRHLQAGSEATATVSKDKMVLVKSVTPETTLEEIVRVFGEDYDIILTEGFKQGSAPKIEVHRQGVGTPLTNLLKLMAIVTDEPLETKTRQFSLEDISSVADLLEEGFIKPQRERLSLYVNGAPIPLSIFPKEFVNNVLLAMASSLKGVGIIKSIEVFVKREPKQD